METTTERAKKRAYFSDVDGGHIVEFQFTPDELNFSEGGRFADRISTGFHMTDYVWISGKPSKFKLTMWVDRTTESFVNFEASDTDPFANITRLPRNNRFSEDNFALVRGLKRAFMEEAPPMKANAINPSVYSPTPDFSQEGYSDNVGVYMDVEALMYYVRPEGFQLGKAIEDAEGAINLSQFQQSRFTPPPKCRFFYGNAWMEGYIEEVKYSLTMMNKILVPRRLEADISFIRTNWGYLNEVTNGDATDFTDVSRSPRYQ